VLKKLIKQQLLLKKLKLVSKMYWNRLGMAFKESGGLLGIS